MPYHGGTRFEAKKDAPNMTNLYDVLNVSRGAPQEVVDVAYLALRRTLPEGDSEQRQAIEAAYDVLGNPARRAAYDASLVAGAEAAIDAPAVERVAVAAAEDEEPAEVIREDLEPTDEPAGDVVVAMPAAAHDTPVYAAEPAASGGGSKMMVILAGVIFLLIAAIGAGLGYVLLSGDDGENYPLNLGDDAYNLEAMGLREADMPQGIVLSQPLQEELAFGTVVGEGIEFSNADWAMVLDQEDPEAKENQLNALGRVRNHVRFFEANPLRYGYPVQYSTQSTLFDDVDSAVESLRTDCDTSRDLSLPVNDLTIKKIGDQSTAFYVLSPTDEVGNIIETVICFRTGRLVHSVTQQGFEGTEDLGIAINLAIVMLDHVEDTFENDQG